MQEVCSYFVLMPEPYWPKRKNSYTLRDAAKNGRYARLRCRYCKMEKYFLIEELIIAFGNIECDDVTYSSKWRCSSCKGLHTIELKIEDPPAAKMQEIRVRRISRIEYIRRVIWKED